MTGPTQPTAGTWSGYERKDGASVCRGGYNAEWLPWEARFPSSRESIYARSLLTTDGRVRRFATAEAAMRAMDKANPIQEPVSGK